MADATVSVLRFVRFLVLIPLIVVGLSVPATAQVIPNDEANLIFEQALEAYDEGDFGMAARRFELVVNSYDVHSRTTAAWVMAGKAHYQAGDYEQAVDLLAEFVALYPNSTYVQEARTVLAYSSEYVETLSNTEIVQVGVLLPLDEGDRTLTQAMFDGIRYAVDEFNGLGGSTEKARLVFRPSGRDAIETTRSVRELADAGVSVIIGPLYSSEALTAAAVAEQSEVVLVAPLATDEEVSAGRSFVYQANPTISMRGRLMARFAMEGLRHDRFGVIAEFDNQVSEKMAEGFQDEVLRSGAEIDFVELLPGPNDWFRLKQRFIPDSLLNIDAIYMPIAGGSAQTLVKGALDSFDRIGIPVRLLGNKEYHNLPSKTQASTYHTVYTTDFHLDPDNQSVAQFNNLFEAATESEPTTLTYVGYDVTRFLLLQLLGERDTRKALERSGFYQGLGIRIDFQGENVNQALYYLRYRNNQVELVR